jgi:predicted ATPase/serine phosphatase RsbU (regulator of sigma subunit)
MKIANFLILDKIYQGKHFTVYRCQQENQSHCSILKVIHKASHRTSNAIDTLKQEYHFLKKVDSNYVIKATDWLEEKDFAAIVMEDIDSKPLSELIEENPLPLSIQQFLPWAISITSGLAAIHQQNIIHKDINPTNIIINPETHALKIIDFNIASTFNVKVSYTANPEKLHGTLPYISPEQTGRVNCRVDQRSDLYSLGATFYQMLTRQLPFQHTSPIELIYDHLARDPKAPHFINPHIPLIISQIILKLLAKNPTERYQSALGLKHDLENYQNQTLTPEKLGEKDFSGKLQVPEKLYGRETEIQQLLDAYKGVRLGAKELILVTGYSGTGKSALVYEIHQSIVRDRGYFINGKFDQLHRSVPYSAFIQVLNQFCQLLLSEKQTTLKRWKQLILKALGKLGKVLTEIIPLLETIIGVQPDIPPMGGQEAKKRFNYVFMRFLQAIAREEHPLVMFIDDLQWADLASLELLYLILEDRQKNHLFFIGAYRDNELSPTHPLSASLIDIQKLDISICTIAIKNLSKENIQEWLSDTLAIQTGNKAYKELQALTDLIYQKTHGNAFFTIQFLDNLHRNNLLNFNYEQFRWTWELPQIQKQNITDNVVDLLVQKIQTLPDNTREMLKLAACIGNRFDLTTLTIISQKSREEQVPALENAIIERLVYPVNKHIYKFIHDRIHQAAYSLISKTEKNPLHLEIGRMLWHNLQIDRKTGTPNDTDLKLFDIVNHMNMGTDLIVDETEKVQLIRLNLETSQMAKMSGAYKLAAEYVQTAIQLLPIDHWLQYYDLALAVFNEAIQTAYLCGNFDQMEFFVETVLSSISDITHSSIAYEYRLMSLMSQNQPHKAVSMLITIFGQLGLNIPKKIGKLETWSLLRKTDALLKENHIEGIKELPPLTDSHKKLIIKLYYVGAGAFAYAAQNDIIYVTAKIIGFTLEHGLIPESTHLLSSYGSKKIHLGDIPGAYQLGETAVQLMAQSIGSETVKLRAKAIIYFFILGHKQHFGKVSNLLNNIYLNAMEAGDIELVGYVLANYIMCLSRTQTPLIEVLQKAKNMRDIVIQLKQSMFRAPILIEIAASSALLGETDDPAELDTHELDQLFKPMQEDTRRIYSWQINIKKIILALLFQKHQHLLDYVTAAEENEKHLTSPITYIKSDFYFYIALAYLQLSSHTKNKKERKQYLKKARKYKKIMKQWADFGPVNFLHKFYLMQAEYCRASGKKKAAAHYYPKATETAYENDYINDAAIANELAGIFFIQNKQEKLATIYLVEARNCYRKWGATAKVIHLDELYPRYLAFGSFGTTHASHLARTFSTNSSDAAAEHIDIKSILKASQTLSGEVQLKSLLQKMMQILIENAGAQKSILIRDTGDKLLIQAEGDTNGVSQVLHGLPVEDSQNLPLSIINYASHGKKVLVFDNVSMDPNYSNDPYIRKNQPKSVVCFPVLKKDRLSAIIYLENNRVEGAFTAARLEVLNMLSAQIAISVENTELYENLEEKVKQRTNDLHNAHQQLEKNHKALEESHKKINDSVNYASRIQEAVLPSLETFSQLFPNHFVIFSPCSTVSGDFYWIKQMGYRIIVAAADCTGHGVPGALVSMLGMAFLNEIVPQLAVQAQLTAGNILDQLRYQVKTALQQKGNRIKQKEGMDIALCIIDPKENTLQYAGAHNPLYIIRDQKPIEIKADRMPIGVHRNERPFSNHDIDIQKGDMIYLFSDGYADQNREIDDEKFAKAPFKKMLTKISTEPTSKQKEILTDRFNEWKGNLPQRDDVLVIGIKID